jgi:hypothetical protein
MAGGGSYAAFRHHYSNGKATNGNGPKWHDAVLDRNASASPRLQPWEEVNLGTAPGFPGTANTAVRAEISP